MNTHLQGLRLCFRGGYGLKVGPLPYVFRSSKWGHRTSWIHSSSTNLASWFTEVLLRQAAEERAGREQHNALPKFRYKESLSPRQFRLLEIYRRGDEIAYPAKAYTLEGTLYVASMDDRTIKYKALSYVWGDSAATESIYIDGSVMKITKNCASALRRILLVNPGVRIWVDSICINQGNDVAALTERGQQVAVMDEIYGFAVEVFIYLGDGNASTRAMFRSLRKIFTALVSMRQASRPEENSLRLSEYVKVVQDEMRKHELLSWLRILVTNAVLAELELLDFTLRDMPWFSRAWVLQEVAVSKTATALCGGDMMNFHDLAIVLNVTAYIPRSQLSAPMLGLANFMQFHWGMSIAIEAMDAGEVVDQKQFPLQNIVMSSLARLNATRPEDQIFSLYGLCKRFGYELPAPDYNRDLTDLDFEVAQCFLKYDTVLKFLMMNSGTTSIEKGLPSWVPSMRGMWQVNHSGLKVSSISEGSGLACSASGTSTVDFQPDGRRLRVKGRVFDYIAELGDEYSTDIDLDKKIQTMPAISLTECIESWWQIFDRVRGLQYPRPMADGPVLYHIDGQNFNQAAAELLTMAKMATKETRPAEQLEAIMSHLAFFRNKTRNSDPTERKTLVLPDEAEGKLHQVGSGYVLSDSIRNMVMEICGYCQWKALGLSSKGYMALFPRGSKVGDKIVVLHGTPGPVVIRPVDGAYQYIGATYVQGIMGGEFWETGAEEDDTWFELI